MNDFEAYDENEKREEAAMRTESLELSALRQELAALRQRAEDLELLVWGMAANHFRWTGIIYYFTRKTDTDAHWWLIVSANRSSDAMDLGMGRVPILTDAARATLKAALEDAKKENNPTEEKEQ